MSDDQPTEVERRTGAALACLECAHSILNDAQIWGVSISQTRATVAALEGVVQALLAVVAAIQEKNAAR